MNRRSFLRRSAFALALLLPWRRNGEAAVVVEEPEEEVLSKEEMAARVSSLNELLKQLYMPDILESLR